MLGMKTQVTNLSQYTGNSRADSFPGYQVLNVHWVKKNKEKSLAFILINPKSW